MRSRKRLGNTVGLLAGTVAVAVSLFSGDIGCGSGGGATASSAPTCNGQPATFPLDDLKVAKEDVFVTQIARAITESLSPGELTYLSQIPPSAISANTLLADPVVRKAMAAAVPTVHSYCTTLTDKSLCFSLGVAHALTPQQQLYLADVGQVISEYLGIVATVGLGVLCGSTPCAVAALIGTLAILTADAKAGDLPPIGDPIFPSLYNNLVEDAGSHDASADASTDATGDSSSDSGPEASPDSPTDSLDDAPCAEGETMCGGGCVSEQTDPENCGACGTKCDSPPPATCSGTQLTIYTGGSCVAGSCSYIPSTTSCPTTESCLDGTCICTAGLSLCGNACVNEQLDPNNCGACGVQCNSPPSATCSGSDLTSYTATCDKGVCYPPTTTPCPPAESCQHGTCGCATGTVMCNGTCVDEQTDASNCGGCGVACPGGTSCVAGSCQCPSGTQLSNGVCCASGLSGCSDGTCRADDVTNCCSLDCSAHLQRSTCSGNVLTNYGVACSGGACSYPSTATDCTMASGTLNGHCAGPSTDAGAGCAPCSLFAPVTGNYYTSDYPFCFGNNLSGGGPGSCMTVTFTFDGMVAGPRALSTFNNWCPYQAVPPNTPPPDPTQTSVIYVPPLCGSHTLVVTVDGSSSGSCTPQWPARISGIGGTLQGSGTAGVFSASGTQTFAVSYPYQ
jgi:hypothetical protein